MAKALLCEKPGARAFCAVCSACRRIDGDIHPDVIVVREDGEDTIKIERVRELCHQMEISPMEALHKICIIQECQRLSVASANAFLKTLEEPASNRHFWLLTTQPGSLLPTLLSRCLVFAFSPQEAAAPAEDSRQIADLEKRFSEAIQCRDPRLLIDGLDDRESGLALLRYVQRQLHARALSPTGSESVPAVFREIDRKQALVVFDAAVALEGRLRSNANCGLLLEDFLRREFLFKESGT
jgi:DNA polymerase-3 subunit delta'